MQTLQLICLLLYSAACCLLAGRNIGKCSLNPLFSTAFCLTEINPIICIPAHNVYPLLFEITWSQYDANYKDSQIKGVFL